jgi:hypothetical protein
MFHVGQKVVFIGPRRDSVRKFFDCINPVVGAVYTIRSIMAPPPGVVGPTGLRLVEIVNLPRPVEDVIMEITFWDKLFRPVQETDISIFTEMLNPVRRFETERTS